MTDKLSKSKCAECAGCTQDICAYINDRNDIIDDFANRLKGIMTSKYCVYFNYELTNAIIDNIAKGMKEEYK